MTLLETVLPTNVLYLSVCVVRDDTVILEINRVDAIMEEPVNVENWLRFRLGTIILDANKVETVRVLLINMVFEFSVEIAIVDAIKEDPVSVENVFSANPGIISVDAIKVETDNVLLITPLFAFREESAAVVPMRDPLILDTFIADPFRVVVFIVEPVSVL